MAGGGLGGQSIRSRTSAASPGPKWAGEMLAMFPSDPPPSGLSPLFVTPLGMGAPALPQLPFRGAGPVPPPLLLPY